jgi:uncharacterized membrane protein YccC
MTQKYSARADAALLRTRRIFHCYARGERRSLVRDMERISWPRDGTSAFLNVHLLTVSLPADLNAADDRRMKLWTSRKEELPSISHAFRTAIAATISVLVARFLGTPEPYWSAIATIVVMQSPLSSTVPLAVQRIVASALGASLGAIESAYFGANLIAFAVAIFVLGILSLLLRLERVGFSYAGITLGIIVLIPRAAAPWIAAADRFMEVSLGILVALAVVGVWREEHRVFGRTID